MGIEQWICLLSLVVYLLPHLLSIMFDQIIGKIHGADRGPETAYQQLRGLNIIRLLFNDKSMALSMVLK